MSDPRTSPHRAAARAHFVELFRDQTGWLELSAIDGDPDDRAQCRFHQSWFAYAPDRLDLLLDQVTALTQRYGDVYSSITLYDASVRDKARALDGRVIFVDDAPPASYTFTVQTSHDREQGYIILDQLADVATREQIARRLAHAGADKSGWDITQLARVPGTFNTKARTGGRYTGPRAWVVGSGHRVTTIPRTLRLYSLHELQGRASCAAATAGTCDPAAIDQPQVMHWLGNLASLLGADGLPRRLSLKSRTRQILAAGLQWSDTSAQRYAVARGLVMHGYPDDEIAALLIHFCDYGKSTAKGSAWLYEDIARVIAKERLAQPTVTIAPTLIRGTQPAAPLPTVARTSRARKDRPTRFTAPELFARYQADPALCELKRKARAAQLAISTATLDRLEDSLERLGLITIDTLPKRAGSRVLLLGGVINITPQEVLSAPPIAAAAESSFAQTASGQNDDRDPQCIGGTHPPGSAPQAANSGEPPIGYDAHGRRLGLLDLVRDALDAVTRPTFKRIRAYVLANAANPQAFSEDGMRRVYQRELARRRYAKQDAKLMAQARNMRASVLKRKSQSAAGLAAKYLQAGDKRAPIWQRIAGIYASEEARRAPADEVTTHELWSELDQETRDRIRGKKIGRSSLASRAARADRGRVFLPLPRPQARTWPPA